MRRGQRCSAQTPFVSFAQVGSNGAHVNLATNLGAVRVSVGADSNIAPLGNGANRVVMGHQPQTRTRDTWLNNQASIEQKRKYRALLKGYRTFKTKCTVKDADIKKAISQTTTGDCGPLRVIHPSELGETATDKAMDIERREMNQLIELLQEGGVGYVPK